MNMNENDFSVILGKSWIHRYQNRMLNGQRYPGDKEHYAWNATADGARALGGQSTFQGKHLNRGLWKSIDESRWQNYLSDLVLLSYCLVVTSGEMAELLIQRSDSDSQLYEVGKL